ncbi:hypothetical protein [Planococcus lenghuensis]|uniref:Uncharacterized protein n=1 Tax=Planococcus lenghuensis TaxID=2213202 RepID=A0A1Q2KV41_9BACL|nr:hypothetical protein [Planococcus lenghuensis]AQQ52013.1 hypothetical protein B0X71_01995 [Planococcus lenghuensis]
MNIYALLLTVLLLLTGCTAGENAIVEEETEAEQVNTDLTGLPEYAALAEEIDLEAFAAEIEKDDKEDRIIFFSSGSGEQLYKSTYTKEEGRLQITSLTDEQIVFDEVLSP